MKVIIGIIQVAIGILFTVGLAHTIHFIVNI